MTTDACGLPRSPVGCAPGLEKLHELLAGAIVIPFAVTLDDLHQVLDRVFALAIRVERDGEIEARLMIERIGKNFLFQVCHRSDRLCLLGNLERGAGGGDRRIVPLGFGNKSEGLLGLIECARSDVAARETGKRLHVRAVRGEDLRIQFSSARGVAFGQRGVGDLQQIFLLGADRAFGDPFEKRHRPGFRGARP